MRTIKYRTQIIIAILLLGILPSALYAQNGNDDRKVIKIEGISGGPFNENYSVIRPLIMDNAPISNANGQTAQMIKYFKEEVMGINAPHLLNAALTDEFLNELNNVTPLPAAE